MIIRCLLFFITFELIQFLMTLMCKNVDPVTAICYGTSMIIATMFMHKFDSIGGRNDDSNEKE